MKRMMLAPLMLLWVVSSSRSIRPDISGQGTAGIRPLTPYLLAGTGLTATDLDTLIQTGRPAHTLQNPAKDFALIHSRLKAYERKSLLANLAEIAAKGSEETKDKVAFLQAMLEELPRNNTERLRKRLAYNNDIPFYLEVLFSRHQDKATLVALMNRLVETEGKVTAAISSALQDLCQFYLRPFVRVANLQPTKDQPRIWAEVDRPGLEKRIRKLPRNRRDSFWQVQVRDALRALDAARGIKHDTR